MVHTPMKLLKEKFEDKLILITGLGELNEVITSYGFKNFLSLDEYNCLFPEIYPFFLKETK
jgi:hypothetical protein